MTIRNTGHGQEFQEHRRFDIDYATLDEAKKALDAAFDGLRDARISIDHDMEYGDCVVRQVVSGWRPATDKEVAAAQVAKAAAAENQRKRDEQQVAHLRKTRPELFK